MIRKKWIMFDQRRYTFLLVRGETHDIETSCECNQVEVPPPKLWYEHEAICVSVPLQFTSRSQIGPEPLPYLWSSNRPTCLQLYSHVITKKHKFQCGIWLYICGICHLNMTVKCTDNNNNNNNKQTFQRRTINGIVTKAHCMATQKPSLTLIEVRFQWMPKTVKWDERVT